MTKRCSTTTPGRGWPSWTAAAPLQAYLVTDYLGVFLGATALLLTGMVAIYSMRYMHRLNIGKFYALLLIMTAGVVGIGYAGDLFTLYVLFEVMGVASFVLVAFERDEWEPVEAGVKYLVISTTGSLLALLDRTHTAMGGRLLRDWLLQPLLDVAAINERLDAVDELRRQVYGDSQRLQRVARVIQQAQG